MVLLGRNQWIVGIFIVVFLLCCWNANKDVNYDQLKVVATHPEGGEFVGSEPCRGCHREIYDQHLQTAHFNTSAEANSETILGPFNRRSRKLELEHLDVILGEQGGSFFQQVHIKEPDQVLAPARMDIVIGSGVKGQSYLTWENDHLFQLQASYYPPTSSWINSPGFPDQYLKRPIRDGCLKCHVTFAHNRDFSGQGNQYDPDKMIFGIDCERCHRPARQHVIHHRSHPEETAAKFMLKLDTLDRQRRLDVCAQCHSGPRDGIVRGTSFSFLSGEILSDYSRNFYTGQADHELDVHGNQYGLLTSSKCFKNSLSMDCSTCHNPHLNERGDIRSFNDRCKNCHGESQTSCSATSMQVSSMQNNCTGCHMPKTPSQAMTVQLTKGAQATSVSVRTHLIGIYPADRWQNDLK